MRNVILTTLTFIAAAVALAMLFVVLALAWLWTRAALGVGQLDAAEQRRAWVVYSNGD